MVSQSRLYKREKEIDYHSYPGYLDWHQNGGGSRQWRDIFPAQPIKGNNFLHCLGNRAMLGAISLPANEFVVLATQKIIDRVSQDKMRNFLFLLYFLSCIQFKDQSYFPLNGQWNERTLLPVISEISKVSQLQPDLVSHSITWFRICTLSSVTRSTSIQCTSSPLPKAAKTHWRTLPSMTFLSWRTVGGSGVDELILLIFHYSFWYIFFDQYCHFRSIQYGGTSPQQKLTEAVLCGNISEVTCEILLSYFRFYFTLLVSHSHFSS